MGGNENTDLLKRKIFDIMTAKLDGKNKLNIKYEIIRNPDLTELNPEQYLAALPHAAEALKLIELIEEQLDKSGDPVENCIRYLFKKKTMWESACYQFKYKLFSMVVHELKDNKKISAHLGMSLTSISKWRKKTSLSYNKKR